MLDIRRQWEAAGVAFFFKQRVGVNKKKTGRLLKACTWDALPGAGWCGAYGVENGFAGRNACATFLRVRLGDLLALGCFILGTSRIN